MAPPIPEHTAERAPLVSTSVLIGAGLAACTTPARQVDARLPAAYEAPAGKPLPSQTLDQWWTTFDDPVLNDLVATALEKAPDARLAFPPHGKTDSHAPKKKIAA